MEEVKKTFPPSKAGNKTKALKLNTYIKGFFYFSKLYYNIEGRMCALANGQESSGIKDCKKAPFPVTPPALSVEQEKEPSFEPIIKGALQAVHRLTFSRQLELPTSLSS